MILEKQSDIEILIDGEEAQTSTAMSLDLDSAQMLMQMLSKNLYSDGIGSTIRETASNALDSHRRAGVKEPIIVSLIRNKEDNIEFSVEDFGSGLDADDVTNIISKYGKSTKRMEANALGMFGLGFKSPLAYTSSFFFVCRKNGVERKYMMYEGEDINTIDLLYETKTTEKNGVKVIVPVKNNDRYAFYTKIKEQLAYFEDVYFQVDQGGYTIKNDFIISRGTHFQFSELASNGYMHLCLDNVYYPLDFSKLGIVPLNIPIGLRFNLTDGIFPTPNRESIRYTPEAIAVIRKKIQEVADYYLEKYNQTIHDSDNVFKVLEFYTSKTHSVPSGFNDTTFVINNLLLLATQKMKNPSIINVKLLDLKRLAGNSIVLTGEYNKKYKLSNGRLSEVKEWEKHVSHIEMTNHHLFSEVFTSGKKAYIRDLFNNHGTQYFIKKVKSYPLFPKTKVRQHGFVPLDNYYTILSLHTVPRAQWRELIKEFQYVQSLCFANVKNIDDLVIPQDWIDARKQKGTTLTQNGNIRRIKLAGEVIGKVGVPLQRYVSGKSSKLEPFTLKLEDTHKLNKLYVYGGTNDITRLDQLFEIVGSKQKVVTLVFSDRELKALEKVKIHNLIHLKEFMKGENKVFKRLITAYVITELTENFPYTFRNSDVLANISTSLHEDFLKLEEYKRKNYVHASPTIYQAMLEVAERDKMFDGEIYPLYVKMKGLLEHLRFLEPIMKRMAVHARSSSVDSEDIHNVLCDLFKYYRIRINYQNYNLVLNDENKEVLEEELIEELIK